VDRGTSSQSVLWQETKRMKFEKEGIYGFLKVVCEASVVGVWRQAGAG